MAVPLTLDNLKGGGAVERLHKAMQDAFENCMDPNTPAKKKRKVTLTLEITPNEDRTMAETSITTAVKAANPTPLQATLVLDRDKRGKAVAAELVVGEAQGAQALPGLHPDGKISTLNSKQA